MFPMQTGQWVLMTLIGPWVVDQHQAGKQDHQLIIQLEHLLEHMHLLKLRVLGRMVRLPG